MVNQFVKSQLEQKAQELGISRNKLLLEGAVDTAQFYAYMKANRPLSNSLLEALASIEQLGLSLPHLKALRALDEYGDEVVRLAAIESLKTVDAVDQHFAEVMKKVQQGGVKSRLFLREAPVAAFWDVSERTSFLENTPDSSSQTPSQ